jgi:tRNA pseudouridine38-40 synthase
MPDKKELRNIRLTLEYNGARYCGWQVQNTRLSLSNSHKKKRKKSIQEVVEDSLHRLLSERVKVIVSGRTDAGVHALAQVANFYTSSKISPSKLNLGLNSLLPEDIKVSNVKEVPSSFHSRYSCKSKLYRYTILNRKHSSPLMQGKVFFYPFFLDIEAMRSESKILLGRHNFSAFCGSLGRDRDPVKTIKKLSILRKKDLIIIDIEGDGFLYNMVRNIVGTLILAGRGKVSKGGLKDILLARDRKKAGQTAPACGLCLIKVKY